MKLNQNIIFVLSSVFLLVVLYAPHLGPAVWAANEDPEEIGKDNIDSYRKRVASYSKKLLECKQEALEDRDKEKSKDKDKKKGKDDKDGVEKKKGSLKKDLKTCRKRFKKSMAKIRKKMDQAMKTIYDAIDDNKIDNKLKKEIKQLYECDDKFMECIDNCSTKFLENETLEDDGKPYDDCFFSCKDQPDSLSRHPME